MPRELVQRSVRTDNNSEQERKCYLKQHLCSFKSYGQAFDTFDMRCHLAHFIPFTIIHFY